MKANATKNDPNLSPTFSHAEFLSGKSNEMGDLMSQLALINVETMRMVKEEAEETSKRHRLHPSDKAAKLRKYVFEAERGLKADL